MSSDLLVMNRHPAHTKTFEELFVQLKYAVSEGLVYEHIGEDGLHLYCYSDETVYEKKWNEATLMARGLIIDPVAQRVVATPFPKFFNIGEVIAQAAYTGIAAIPDCQFEVFEKLDGSLIIIFHHNGKWRCATKGSLSSDQAKWAEGWISHSDLSNLNSGCTYLAEAIYPENRIVVDYGDKSGLHLLGAYDATGFEYNYEFLIKLGKMLNWPVVARGHYASISELLDKAKELSSNEEGWVLRFANGTRLKIKGDEYCRIHRLISCLTPLAIWRQLEANEDMENVRRSLPEEFWEDFDTIIKVLTKKLTALLTEIKVAADEVSSLSDKEVGLRLDSFASHIRRFIFPYRKGSLLDGKARHAIFDTIRPDRNVLEGYRASSSMARVQENLKE